MGRVGVMQEGGHQAEASVAEGSCIRLSPHFYNTDAELERLLQML